MFRLPKPVQKLSVKGTQAWDILEVFFQNLIFLWSIFENFSIRWLSQSRNDFFTRSSSLKRFHRWLIQHWKKISRLLHQRSNFASFCHGHPTKYSARVERISSLSESTWKRFHRWLKQRGNDFFYVMYSTLLHLPPLRFHCVRGCWDRTPDCCNFGIGSQTL